MARPGRRTPARARVSAVAAAAACCPCLSNGLVVFDARKLVTTAFHFAGVDSVQVSCGLAGPHLVVGEVSLALVPLDRRDDLAHPRSRRSPRSTRVVELIWAISTQPAATLGGRLLYGPEVVPRRVSAPCSSRRPDAPPGVGVVPRSGDRCGRGGVAERFPTASTAFTCTCRCCSARLSLSTTFFPHPPPPPPPPPSPAWATPVPRA